MPITPTHNHSNAHQNALFPDDCPPLTVGNTQELPISPTHSLTTAYQNAQDMPISPTHAQSSAQKCAQASARTCSRSLTRRPRRRFNPKRRLIFDEEDFLMQIPLPPGPPPSNFEPKSEKKETKNRSGLADFNIDTILYGIESKKDDQMKPSTPFRDKTHVLYFHR